MLLELLAAHRDTCPYVLDALTQQALAGKANAAPIALALAGNPAVDIGTCVRLVAAHPLAAANVFSRPDVDAAAAVELLGARPNVDVARSALAHVADPNHGLLAHLRTARPDSIHLCSDIVAHPQAPTDARVAAARVLVAHYQVTPADARRIARFARTLMLTDPADGERHTRDLLALSVDRTVSEYLTVELGYLQVPPPPGTYAWFQDPATSVEDVIGWATAKRRTSAWTTALRDYDDPTGQVAHAAMAAQRRPQRWPLERIVRTERLPVTLRQSAARRLADAGWTQWSTCRELASLLTHADLEFLGWYLDRFELTHTTLGTLSGRGDLTGDLVAALDRARTALATSMTPQPHGHVIAASSWQWDLWLLTHPGTHTAQRSAAAQRLQNGPDDGRPAWARTTARTVTNSGALTARDLPVALSLVRDAAARTPGSRALLEDALGQLVTTARGRDAAVAVLALAPTFPGTYGELLDTLAVLAAA